MSRCYWRSGDDLGVVGLPWCNVGRGDALVLVNGQLAQVVEVVSAAPGSEVGALVKVATLPSFS